MFKDILGMFCISGNISNQTKAYTTVEHNIHSDIAYMWMFKMPSDWTRVMLTDDMEHVRMLPYEGQILVRTDNTLKHIDHREPYQMLSKVWGHAMDLKQHTKGATGLHTRSAPAL